MEYTAAKDAPIIAAAKHAPVDYLVSLDRQHLVEVSEVAQGQVSQLSFPASSWRKCAGAQEAIDSP